MAVDPNLPAWTEIETKDEWSGLLVGNGASRAVWDRFAYGSLYQKAMSADVQHPLLPADQGIFQALGTENFEATMFGLDLSRKVCAALSIPTQQIDQRYNAIQTALIEAVQAVHIGWGLMPAVSLEKMRNALLPYDYVYSTNYDLLIYWAIMHDPKATGFADYFWGANCIFDLGNTEVWPKVTKVLYLHGAIHLYRLLNGITVKKTAVNAGNLLTTFGQPFKGVDVPLFVAEGQADDKQRSIRRSEYLAFAFSKFSDHHGSLVVFGHGLGNSDQHLVNAMKHWSRLTVPQIAISMQPDTPQNIVARKATLQQALPKMKLLFFDSTTHPLGDPTLKVNP
ncbi:MAG TPA: DUF4917 family protein [Candidatus Micrarchaeaceae archaeon]|nr:DUF4917 family protein [Candidatus Micrarchaeaceae archaeon]